MSGLLPQALLNQDTCRRETWNWAYSVSDSCFMLYYCSLNDCNTPKDFIHIMGYTGQIHPKKVLLHDKKKKKKIAISETSGIILYACLGMVQ